MNSSAGRPAEPVLLIGPSTRAMAYSARRAGYEPVCVDLFADLDLQAIAQVECIPMSDYPAGLIGRLGTYPPAIPVVYTGGLENHPKVLLELSWQRPLWGYVHADPQHGDSIRNPLYFDKLADETGLNRPRHPWKELPRSGRWLKKPVSSAGGRGIVPWLPGSDLPVEHFVEEFLEGPSLAAVYVRMGKTVRFLGITQQLIGASFVHAPTPFVYTGSVGPYPVADPALKQTLDDIGRQLVTIDPALHGLFGVDMILHDGQPYLLEVNPRYTASIEVLELATGVSFFDLHVQGFDGRARLLPSFSPSTIAQRELRPPAGSCDVVNGILGKAIYFAPRRLTFPKAGPWSQQSNHDVWTTPQFADIPVAGSIIETGHPVLTLFATGNNGQHVMESLRMRACELDSLFRH